MIAETLKTFSRQNLTKMENIDIEVIGAWIIIGESLIFYTITGLKLQLQ